MDFLNTWQRIQSDLSVGTKIKNWTAARGYLGDEFSVVRVEHNHVEINAPNAETIQRVRKSDFEFMCANWVGYCSGKVNRQALVKGTRVSKYTISILKYLDQ